MQIFLRTLAAAAIAAGSAGAFAGAVEVNFVNPSQFIDAGSSPAEERDNLEALARHLRKLGRELLPANQVLRIEVLDVDLAGTVREPVPNGARFRVMRGDADWPRINLRYTLETDGQAARSGEESLSDPDYQHGKPDKTRDSGPLYYEKRMLERWFRERFAGEPRAASH
jgi:hypothetical protein